MTVLNFMNNERLWRKINKLWNNISKTKGCWLHSIKYSKSNSENVNGFVIDIGNGVYQVVTAVDVINNWYFREEF